MLSTGFGAASEGCCNSLLSLFHLVGDIEWVKEDCRVMAIRMKELNPESYGYWPIFISRTIESSTFSENMAVNQEMQ